MNRNVPPAITTGIIFFITLPGWRIPVCTTLTPDFHVPHYHSHNMSEEIQCQISINTHSTTKIVQYNCSCNTSIPYTNSPWRAKRFSIILHDSIFIFDQHKSFHPKVCNVRKHYGNKFKRFWSPVGIQSYRHLSWFCFSTDRAASLRGT